MPKILQQEKSPRDLGLPTTSTSQLFKSNSARAKYSSPVFQVKCIHRSHDVEQNMIWYDDAMRRASGRSTLRRPSVDRMQCNGRTIYDAQCGPSKPRYEDANLAQSTSIGVSSSRCLHHRRKPSVHDARRRSLIDETLCQAENGRAIRKLSTVFALDVFTTSKPSQILPVDEVAAVSEDDRRLSVPSLTWSDSPGGGSDTDEVFFEDSTEKLLAPRPPLIVDPLLNAFLHEFLLNPLDPLGHMHEPWPSTEVSMGIWDAPAEIHDTANQFFDMFVNTDDCEDIC